MLQPLRMVLAAAFAMVIWPPLPAYTDDVPAATVSHIVRTDAGVFYLEGIPGANVPRLMLAIGAAPARLLLDPQTLRKRLGLAVRLSISTLLPSPDGTHVAVALVPGGVERATHTRIIETRTGNLLADDLPRTKSGPTAWSLDGTTLFYSQLSAAAPGRAAETQLRSIVYAHRLATTETDAAVFGFGVDPNVPIGSADAVVLTIPTGSNYAIAAVRHGTASALILYAAPIAAVLSGGQIPWRQIVAAADGVVSFDVHGNIAYLLAHSAARDEVRSLDLLDPDAAVATLVSEAAADGAISQLAVASDALYVRGVRDGSAQLRKLPWGSDGSAGAMTIVALPFPGAIREFAADARVDGALVALESRTRPLVIDALDASGTFVDAGIGEAPAAGADRANR